MAGLDFTPDQEGATPLASILARPSGRFSIRCDARSPSGAAL
jgi:hypothetical protein